MSSNRRQQGNTVIRMDILPPDPSGRAARAFRRGGEVVDAQFVTVGAAARRSARPRFQNDNCRQTVSTGALAERAMTAVEGALSRLSADFFSAIVALLFVAVFTLAGGFSFLFSGTDRASAGPVLDITHVTMTPQDANGMKVLLINGIVENRTGASVAMPAIRADLMSGEDVVASTLISPPVHAIAGGHSRGFSARVPHPGGKLPDLRLALAERGA